MVEESIFVVCVLNAWAQQGKALLTVRFNQADNVDTEVIFGQKAAGKIILKMRAFLSPSDPKGFLLKKMSTGSQVLMGLSNCKLGIIPEYKILLHYFNQMILH